MDDLNCNLALSENQIITLLAHLQGHIEVHEGLMDGTPDEVSYNKEMDTLKAIRDQIRVQFDEV